jgi:hypothetical protein
MKGNEQTILAESPGFGRVYDCGDCGCIHMQVGAVAITFTPDAYMKLAAMVNSNAATMEMWMQGGSGESGSGGVV